MAVKSPLARNVKALSAVSFFTDVASEMIYPLLPLFLTTVLGASAAAIGVIEGIAETISSLLRLPAGWLSDRLGRRKPLILLGYGIAAVARPLIGLSQGVGQVLAIRASDRFGKGIRSSPRDALIADSVPERQRGYAFGVHRAADSFGAVIGPLIAWAVLGLAWVDLRELFLWAAVPGLISVLLVLFVVREVGGARHAEAPRSTDPTGSEANAARAAAATPLGAPFWRYLAVLFVFTLSTSTDAFLLLRASQLGVPTALIPILWAMLHVVKSSANAIGGGLSDRLGRRPLILGGWAIYAAVYLGFAFAIAQWQVWFLFLAYGLYFGMTEGTEKALVADLVPVGRRGTAYGWFHAALGIGALPASVVFGLVWGAAGAQAAFTMGAGIAMLAALLFSLVVRVPQRAA